MPMSMAQQLLFRMSYGFGVFESAVSWQRYEVVISEYVSVLLSGLNGHKLRELLERLGMPKDSAGPPAADITMSFGTVSTVHSRRWIRPKHDYTAKGARKTRHEPVKIIRGILQQCAPQPVEGMSRAGARKREDTATVIVNGSGAPYADIIVVIPRVAVILVQCKFYGESTSLTEEMIETEAKKLSGVLEEVNKLAGVPRDGYFRILATNKTRESVPDDLRGFSLLTTSSENALAPLFTPVCYNEFREADVKFVRKVGAVSAERAVASVPSRPAKRARQSEMTRVRAHIRGEGKKQTTVSTPTPTSAVSTPTPTSAVSTRAGIPPHAFQREGNQDIKKGKQEKKIEARFRGMQPKTRN
ncbi:Hypothetical protein, putative [Bodo saltans]|uniref:Uncharacterized protein n=1 Tax=Bodo saltans TaxID=75058 RepID=A0A0S4J4X3_BODSA|nr:Hypothetical protein, putative [Bodo saltans]|eukprot:CUG81474.1 Hypothetical protein, putative [Bodo saltans]